LINKNIHFEGGLLHLRADGGVFLKPQENTNLHYCFLTLLEPTHKYRKSFLGNGARSLSLIHLDSQTPLRKIPRGGEQFLNNINIHCSLLFEEK